MNHKIEHILEEIRTENPMSIRMMDLIKQLKIELNKKQSKK